MHLFLLSTSFPVKYICCIAGLDGGERSGVGARGEQAPRILVQILSQRKERRWCDKVQGGAGTTTQPHVAFTGESQYTHATQDTDHGAPSSQRELIAHTGDGYTTRIWCPPRL